MSKKDDSTQLRIVRVFDAPLSTVWEAWTDPDQVAQWWGPRGFSLTTHSKDLRPGGSWHYTMHGPDGVDYENTTAYLEVEERAKLVYDHGGHRDRPPLFRVTALFSEEAGKTTLDMTMSLPSPEAAREIKAHIKAAGGNTTWDRLAEYVEKGTSGKDAFFISRSFEAPLERMFSLWTEPEHFSQWLPPQGFSMDFLRADIREGGTAFYRMTGVNDLAMYGRVAYVRKERPHLLVYTQQFCDERENISRHPFAPTWPETMLTTVTLASEGENRTRVTVRWEPYGAVSAEESDTFIRSRGGMSQGWTGSFDKLDGYLSSYSSAPQTSGAD